MNDTKSVIQRLFADFFQNEDFPFLANNVHPSFHFENDLPGRRDGPLALLDFSNVLRSLIPNPLFRLNAMNTTDRGTTLNWSATGLHEGTLPGLAPSARHVGFEGEARLEFEGDKLARARFSCGLQKLCQQLLVSRDYLHDSLTRNTQTLLIRTQGKTHGTPVVFIPPGPTPGWLTWGRLSAQLGKSKQHIHFQSLATEIAAEGRVLPLSYTVDMETEALANSVKVLDIKRPFDLLAWSHGGTQALDLLLKYPHWVRSLVLVEPSVSWFLDDALRNRPDIQDIIFLFSGEPIDVVITESRLEKAWRTRSMIPDDFDVRNWAGWSNILAYRQSYTSKISFQKHRGDIDKLSHMKMPILLVRGTRTLDAYRDVVGALATHLPSAKIQEIEGTHNAWLENLEKFSLMIQEFHTSLDRPCELLQAKRPADE